MRPNVRSFLLAPAVGLTAIALTGCVPAAEAATPEPIAEASPAGPRPAGNGFYMYCTPIDRTPGYYCTPVGGSGQPPAPVSPPPTTPPPTTQSTEPPIEPTPFPEEPDVRPPNTSQESPQPPTDGEGTGGGLFDEPPTSQPPDSDSPPIGPAG